MPTLRAAIKKAKSMKPDLADRVERIGLEWHKGAILSDNDMRAIVAALRATSGYVHRDVAIEEVAKAVESAPLTYAGPDPQGIRDLRYLLVLTIRDMKGKK